MYMYIAQTFAEGEISPTQIEKIENRSGATPVVVSAASGWKSTDVATEIWSSGATPVEVSELDQARRESDPGRLEIYRNRFWSD